MKKLLNYHINIIIFIKILDIYTYQFIISIPECKFNSFHLDKQSENRVIKYEVNRNWRREKNHNSVPSNRAYNWVYKPLKAFRFSLKSLLWDAYVLSYDNLLLYRQRESILFFLISIRELYLDYIACSYHNHGFVLIKDALWRPSILTNLPFQS